MNNSMVSTEMISTVREVRILTPNTFVLRFDRLGMHFLPGQYITLGVHGDTETREYSIYSPTAQDYLEVLIKEVEDGILSKKLKRLQAGDKVRMEGPFGFSP
ncbi:MAG: hypothetical protein HC896_03740 [Bacteroidales bacterium]|nr:hypothetical protein [Bacteroidales bacterium]